MRLTAKHKTMFIERGFTLIELLVVIAIIGMLLSLVIVSFGNARAKSRDARRISDMQQIRSGLEIYYNTGPNGYPDVATWNSAVNTGSALACNGVNAMDTPRDPGAPFYNYIYVTTGSGRPGCGSTVWDDFYVQFATEKDSELGAPGTYYMSPVGISTTPPT